MLGVELWWVVEQADVQAVAGMWCVLVSDISRHCSIQIVPMLNSWLGLVTLPDDETRFHLLLTIGTTLIGSLLWDRLCVAIFAPRIFSSQLDELRSLSVSDFWGPDSAHKVIMAVGAVTAYYMFEGNWLLLLAGFWFYRHSRTQHSAQPTAR
ncbi:MAG: hypothetical protein SGPRY_003614 [Prymnesium sp.]